MVRDLRVMLDCMISSWFALFWAVVLTFFLTYIFALIFVQACTEYIIQNKETMDPDELVKFKERFGSVQDGILTLIMSLTGGIDWITMYSLLQVTGPIGLTGCIFFVLFFSISVWNIIGSIFVQKVMATAEPGPHEVIQLKRLQDKVDAVQIRQKLATDIDEDGKGLIHEDAFFKGCEEGVLKEFMAVRDIAINDPFIARVFFQLALDEDSRTVGKTNTYRGTTDFSSKVTLDALVATSLKVKGQAKSLDLMVLRHDVLKQQEDLEMIKTSLNYLIHAQKNRDDDETPFVL
jgi:hypothetical protein